MQKFTNPLDNIRIASPCSADWNEMFGNERTRFCGDCKLNVYNLSDMTRTEAEGFLTAAEGRVCVRFFQRSDGTVLTKNCPVGLKAVKQKVSRALTAVFSLIAGLFGGLLAFNLIKQAPVTTVGQMSIDMPRPVRITPVVKKEEPVIEVKGDLSVPEMMGKMEISQPRVKEKDSRVLKPGEKKK